MSEFEDLHGVAHHGPPILTRRDESICLAMAAWIAIARERYGKDWLPGSADICKSRLFWRLRSGKPALKSPPPTAYSCPWYELIDESERAHWAYDMHDWEGIPYFAQCPYKLLERDESGKPSKVSFGPYTFKCWMGNSPYGGNNQGWWLQLEPAAAIGSAHEALQSGETSGGVK